MTSPIKSRLRVNKSANLVLTKDGTEAAAVDAFVAMLLTLTRRGITWSGLKEVIIGTAKVTDNHSYVFNIKS